MHGNGAYGERAGHARADPRRYRDGRPREGLRRHLDRRGYRRGRADEERFFYHFRDKNELARALLERYLVRDDALLDDVFDRGRELSDDPLHGFLVGLKLLAETMADLPGGHPGCLVATYCYQERLFDRQVRDLNCRIVLNCRTRFRRIIDEIAERHVPRDTVDFDALADIVSATVEGGLVLSRATADPDILPRQILLLRSYIKLLFAPGNTAIQ